MATPASTPVTGDRIAAWKRSVKAASENPGIQVILSLMLLLPLIATIAQYWTTGFFRQTPRILILFWPGAEWKWTAPVNVGAFMSVIGASYIVGIVWLFRRRTLGKVMAAGVGAAIAAQLLGNTVNHFTGWKELQSLSSMDFSGKVNRAILAQWHNPLWEEVVFRGIPLLCLFFLVKKWPGARRTGTWFYFLVPSLAFAAYHVPGHGYARITDTFVLSLVFAWLALKYGFWAVLVLHYIFDAVSVLSLGHAKGAPADEVRWLADRFTVLNSAFSLGMMAVLFLMIVLIFRHRWRERKGIVRAAAA
jgi:hypothetical protein